MSEATRRGQRAFPGSRPAPRGGESHCRPSLVHPMLPRSRVFIGQYLFPNIKEMKRRFLQQRLHRFGLILLQFSLYLILFSVILKTENLNPSPIPLRITDYCLLSAAGKRGK
ncbi:Methyltransferase psoC [Fusarium oxysporum f. sp. albedinis]|nr:Methyltransferase psoC [Fusarium oxysporum f. sp. albedinis]